MYYQKYENSNCKYFTELLEEHEGIVVSETFIRKLLHENDIYPPRTWKRTIKRKKNTMKVVATELTDNNSISNFEVPIETLHPTKEKKKVYRPPMDHPWRRNTFDNFAVKQQHIHEDEITHMYNEF